MPVWERQEVQAVPRPDGVALHRAGSLKASAVAVGFGALTTLVAVRPPSTLPIPPCPFRAVTGLLCPFCGSTRAVHHLMHGHLSEAVAYNPLGTLTLPLAIIFLVAVVLIPLVRTGRIRSFAVPRWVFVVVAVVVLGFGVWRDIPGLWPFRVLA